MRKILTASVLLLILTVTGSLADDDVKPERDFKNPELAAARKDFDKKMRTIDRKFYTKVLAARKKHIRTTERAKIDARRKAMLEELDLIAKTLKKLAEMVKQTEDKLQDLEE